MIECPACHHDRLMHDSWGCKASCTCGVSIIYLTPRVPAQRNPAVEEQLIEQGNALVQEVELRRESEIEQLNRRRVLELAPPPSTSEPLQ